jgi:hypothetical protein
MKIVQQLSQKFSTYMTPIQRKQVTKLIHKKNLYCENNLQTIYQGFKHRLKSRSIQSQPRLC